MSTEPGNSNQGQDRRQYSRVPFTSIARLQHNDMAFDTDVVDISLNGILVKTPDKYHIRTDMPCRIVITLDDEIEVQMNVTLVHTSSSLLGFHCTSIDMESMSHLRRVIEMNLADPMAAERVLGELVNNQEDFS